MIKNKQKVVEQRYVDVNLRAKKMMRNNRVLVERYKFITKYRPDSNPEITSKPHRYMHHTIDSRSYVDKLSPKKLSHNNVPERVASSLQQSAFEHNIDNNTQTQAKSEQILLQRARQFVSRLRNQKRHLKGLGLLRKKQQEENKKLQQSLQMQQRNRTEVLNQEYKITKMMSNIIQHEHKINSRLNMSLERVKHLTERAKTQNSVSYVQQSQELIDGKYVSSVSKVLSLKKKIRNLQSKIRTLIKD